MLPDVVFLVNKDYRNTLYPQSKGGKRDQERDAHIDRSNMTLLHNKN